MLREISQASKKGTQCTNSYMDYKNKLILQEVKGRMVISVIKWPKTSSLLIHIRVTADGITALYRHFKKLEKL